MTCNECGYTWSARKLRPKKCPNPLCQASLVRFPKRRGLRSPEETPLTHPAHPNRGIK